MIKQAIGEIRGQEIVSVRGETSFHKHYLVFMDDEDNEYRMKPEQVLAFNDDFNSIIFNIIQDRKYKYLEVQE